VFVNCEVVEVTREVKRVECEHCGDSVPVNVYSRSHGDKCSYKDVKPGHKRCRKCNEEVLIDGFTTVATSFDGRSSTCNRCLVNKYYYERKYPMLFGDKEEEPESE